MSYKLYLTLCPARARTHTEKKRMFFRFLSMIFPMGKNVFPSVTDVFSDGEEWFSCIPIMGGGERPLGLPVRNWKSVAGVL